MESNYGFLITQDGSHTLVHPKYLTTFHSHHGAVTESQKVFLEYGYHYLAGKIPILRIFEFGFGTGLNAWLTAKASIQLGIPTLYTALDETYLTDEIVNSLNYTDVSSHFGGDRDIFTRIHMSDLAEETVIHPYFKLHKIQSDWHNYYADQKFDLIYFDAFAPDTQPDLWSLESMIKCAGMLETGGVFVTYCAKGQVKRNLKAAGFNVKALPGPPGKREVTRAVKL